MWWKAGVRRCTRDCVKTEETCVKRQRAVKAEGMSSHTALAEVVPLARGFWCIVAGCILVIGLEALSGADKSISPFLKPDAVKTRQWDIMLPNYSHSISVPTTGCHVIGCHVISETAVKQHANEIPTCSYVWNRWCAPGTAPQSSIQYCTLCTGSPLVWRLIKQGM